ncbi:MAG: hypothetical protein QM709_15805 [Spongiibacteraceae bacterium]
MMAPLALFSIALLLCIAFSLYSYHRACRHVAAGDNASTQLIDGTLALIQLLQKHRGLGAQQSGVAVTQRTQIAREIDYRWRDWAIHLGDLEYLQTQWMRLKNTPSDFEGHSHIIKDLLGFIEILALRVNGPALDQRLAFAERCRALEDLAKLRGLSARAANYPQCPIELKVMLKYLCTNLHSSGLQNSSNALRAALNEINQNMLDANRTTISAARCFEILTPIIDEALDELRQSINTLNQSSNHQQMNLAYVV